MGKEEIICFCSEKSEEIILFNVEILFPNPQEVAGLSGECWFCCICDHTQYPIIRNGDQRWALEFLKNFQFPDDDRFLILQGWVLAVS